MQLCMLIGATILMKAGGTELPLKAEVYLPFEYLDVDKKLAGGTYSGTADGNVSTVTGVLGNGLFISGVGYSLVSLGEERTSCFSSPELCTQGYTVGMWVNIGKVFGSPVYLINNGGDKDNLYGIDIRATSKSGKWVLGYKMKTKSRWYEIECLSPFSSYVWVHLAFVWSLETGAVGYMDGERCSNDTAWTSEPVNSAYFNEFYVGKSNSGSNKGGADAWYDELLFWPEEKDDDFISSLYDMYQGTNVLGTRKMTMKKVLLKTLADKKLVDSVGQAVSVKSRFDCIRKCSVADVMCLAAEWRETGQICKLANVIADDGITVDAAGVVIYAKFPTPKSKD